MRLLLPLSVRFVLHRLHQFGYEAYAVGGAVRDVLLHRLTTDWDFTTNATPEQIMTVFKHRFYNNTFGTVGLPVEGLMEEMTEAGWPYDDSLIKDKNGNDRVIDVTTYRSEFGYSDNRRPDTVTWGTSLQEDVARRDFTINSLALTTYDESITFEPIEVEIVDLFNGQTDLQNRLIRAVGDPTKRFQEDALRMMRAIRFGAQLGFTVEQQTLEAIKQNAQLIQHISWERIRDEFLKIIKSDYPAEGVLLLYNAGLLEYILPEMIAMRGVKQGGHHIYDVWNHSLEALRGCPSSDPIVRLATLLHDIGKPKTVRYQGPRGVTFYGHEVIGARMVATIGERLRLSNEQIKKLTILVRWHMFAYNPEMTDAAIRRFMKNVGLENINDLMLLRVGDRKGGGSKATSWRLNELQQRIGEQLYEPMSLKDLAVNGADVMETLHIPPSKQVGMILSQLFDEVLEDSNKNNRDYLLQRIRELVK